MTEYFILTVLSIYGIHASTRPGMILSWVRSIFDSVFLKVTKSESITMILLKPLFDCTPCMASIYGTAIHLLLWPQAPMFVLIIWVFSLSGFNYILNKLINR